MAVTDPDDLARLLRLWGGDGQGYWGGKVSASVLLEAADSLEACRRTIRRERVENERLRREIDRLNRSLRLQPLAAPDPDGKGMVR